MEHNVLAWYRTAHTNTGHVQLNVGCLIRPLLLYNINIILRSDGNAEIDLARTLTYVGLHLPEMYLRQSTHLLDIKWGDTRTREVDRRTHT